MTDTNRHVPHDEDPIEMANDMLRRSTNRTMSPRAAAMEGAPGRPTSVEDLEGQLGPDEISEPDEVIRNNEAKLHH